MDHLIQKKLKSPTLENGTFKFGSIPSANTFCHILYLIHINLRREIFDNDQYPYLNVNAEVELIPSKSTPQNLYTLLERKIANINISKAIEGANSRDTDEFTFKISLTSNTKELNNSFINAKFKMVPRI